MSPLHDVRRRPVRSALTAAGIAIGVAALVLLGALAEKLGSQVARHFQVDTGATIAIRGKTFRVAGVLEPTLTGPDSFVFMPFATAESLLVESEPLLRRLAMVPGSSLLPIATAAAVFWAD